MSFQDFRIIGNRVAQIDSDGVVGYRFPNEGGTSGQAMILEEDNQTLNFKDIEGGGGASVTISDNPPENPNDGDLWYDTLVDYQMYVWYEEEQKWIDTQVQVGGFFNQSLRIVSSDNQVLKLIYGNGPGLGLAEEAAGDGGEDDGDDGAISLSRFSTVQLEDLFITRPIKRIREGINEEDADVNDDTHWSYFAAYSQPGISEEITKQLFTISEGVVNLDIEFDLYPYNSLDGGYNRLSDLRGHDLTMTIHNDPVIGEALRNSNWYGRQIQILVNGIVTAQTPYYDAGSFGIENGKNQGVERRLNWFSTNQPSFDNDPNGYNQTTSHGQGSWTVVATADDQTNTVVWNNIPISGTGDIKVRYQERTWAGRYATDGGQGRATDVTLKFTPKSRLQEW